MSSYFWIVPVLTYYYYKTNRHLTPFHMLCYLSLSSSSSLSLLLFLKMLFLFMYSYIFHRGPYTYTLLVLVCSSFNPTLSCFLCFPVFHLFPYMPLFIFSAFWFSYGPVCLFKAKTFAALINELKHIRLKFNRDKSTCRNPTVTREAHEKQDSCS